MELTIDFAALALYDIIIYAGGHLGILTCQHVGIHRTTIIRAGVGSLAEYMVAGACHGRQSGDPPLSVTLVLEAVLSVHAHLSGAPVVAVKFAVHRTPTPLMRPPTFLANSLSACPLCPFNR